MTLAFLAALQHLPGRQRAVLILRDVLAWRADEVAELLDMTVAAVNSALQRARATMQRCPAPTGRNVPPRPTPGSRRSGALCAAWETADMPRLVALLRDDAVLTMPPLPAWYQGRAAILASCRAISSRATRGPLPPGPHAGQRLPGLRAYTRAARMASTVREHCRSLASPAISIAAIHDFLVLDDRLFARFDLAPTI